MDVCITAAHSTAVQITAVRSSGQRRCLAGAGGVATRRVYRPPDPCIYPPRITVRRCRTVMAQSERFRLEPHHYILVEVRERDGQPAVDDLQAVLHVELLAARVG